MGIGTQPTEDPEKILEDEFKDLHLNLPILEVPALALMYNAILDKYYEKGSLGLQEKSPYWTTSSEGIGAIPINLKRNMWELEDLIKSPINWDKPPKNRDGEWHAKIRLINPDGDEFTKTLQPVPTSRKLSGREDPREIIYLDHFYDT
ncbi:hypothetical protein Tco_0590644 [Tanacetum coccineum]